LFCRYIARKRRRAVKLGAITMSAALALGGCAPRMAPPAGAPVADPEAAAAALQRASIPDAARQATFAWTLDEAGSRLRGRGVARYVAPERIRLDLFGPRGETYLAAALVNEEFRVPNTVAPTAPLPSAALLWATVGVVKPPADARLLSVTETQRELIVRYATENGETFEYRASGDPLRLTAIARAGRTGVSETIQLTRDATGELQSARYRDLAAYRELVLTLEAMTEVASFPPTIWSPDGTAG
jgi:hypothetical protein